MIGKITAWAPTHRYRKWLGGFAVATAYSVFLLAACAYQPKLAYKETHPPRAAIEGEHCSVVLAEDRVPGKAVTLTAGLTKDGKTAICSDHGASKKPKLLMIAGQQECVTDRGVTRANDVFSNYIIQVSRRDRVIFNPLTDGKVSCQDSNNLAGGGYVEIRALFEQESKEKGPTIALVTAAEIIGLTNPQAPSNMLVDSIVDFECVMNDFHTNAIYGRWSVGGVDTPSLLLVCDPDAPAEESFICATPAVGRRIAIIGNERANKIKPAHEPIPCGAGNTLEVAPPSSFWLIEELWIVGWGGEDTLSGINDTNTTNVIFGDYLCGRPVGENGEYEGAGGDDTIYGGPGDDKLYGEEGDDTIHGGEGNDEIVGTTPCLGYPPDSDHIWGGIGDDKIWGDSAVSAPESAGDRGAELLTGGRDTIFGMAGDDTILGGPGDDEIFGDAFDWAEMPDGEDNICGEAGTDRIHPGPGCDEIFTDGDDYVLGDQLPCDYVSTSNCPWE